MRAINTPGRPFVNRIPFTPHPPRLHACSHTSLYHATIYLDVNGPVNAQTGFKRDYKRTIKLEKIDPVGGIVAEWELHGAFIQELNHEMVWDNTVGQVEMRIVFDHALLIH